MSLRTFWLLLLIFPCSLTGQNSVFQPFSPSEGILSQNVSDVHYDKSGNLWVLTDQALYRFRGNQQFTFTSKNGLPELPSGIYEDNRGRIWLYGASGEFGKASGNEIKKHPGSVFLSAAIGEDLVNSFAAGGNGKFYVNTVIHGKNLQVDGDKIGPLKLVSNSENFVARISPGIWLWGREGKSRRDNKICLRQDSVRHPFSLGLTADPGLTKSLFLSLQNGQYLFAKGHELMVFSDSALVSRTFLEKTVESVYEDFEGKLWVGLYNGGVICYPAGASVLSGGISYMGEKSVNSITGDPKGNIWLGTAGEGVFRMQGRPEFSYQEPKIFTEGSRNAEAIFLQPSLRNLDEISEVQVPINDVVPVVFFTGIRINGSDTSLSDHFELPYDQDVIRISYGGSGRSGEQLRYRYRLWGFDADWIYTDNTHAMYSKLPAGEYQFIAEAVGSDGTWSANSAVINFRVLPPFWKDPWIQGGAAFAFVSLVLGTGIAKVRTIRKKEKAKSELQRWTAELEMKALRSQMNPHFIFNTLASIQHFITENNSERANHFLSRFSRLMRTILDHSRKAFVPLSEEIEMLRIYLELECLRSGERFLWNIELANDLDPGAEEIPPMLLQPYIENAIWHGLLPLQRKGTLNVRISRQNENLIVLIEDDGVGRSVSESSKHPGHKSHGMSITSERLELLSRLENQNFTVQIKDLQPGAAECGTRVELIIPTANS